MVNERDVNYFTLTFPDNDFGEIFSIAMGLLYDHTIKERIVELHNQGKLREFIDSFLLMGYNLHNSLDKIPVDKLPEYIKDYEVYLTKHPVNTGVKGFTVLSIIDYTTNSSYTATE